MLNLSLICVGKLKDKFFSDAANEYLKRLAPFCKTQILEIPEQRLPACPSDAELQSALSREAAAISDKFSRRSFNIALCIEGKSLDSLQLSNLIADSSNNGFSKITFIIGGSFGLHDNIKNIADFRLSLSKLTFPHTLARVILLEQIYRCFKITEGGKYHK